MANFKYYQANSVYQDIYIPFPVVLLYNKKYKDLSDSAKIMYTIFKDRLKYSIKNHWVDSNGYVYFIYTINELKEVLNIKSPTTIIKLKKELIEHNLLKEVHQGNNKPNRLYLAELESDPKDKYLQKHMENFASETLSGDMIPVSTASERVPNSGSPKNVDISASERVPNSGSPKNVDISASMRVPNSGSPSNPWEPMDKKIKGSKNVDISASERVPNSGHNLYINDSLDTRRYYLESNKISNTHQNKLEKNQESYLREHISDLITPQNSIFNENGIEALQLFCKSYNEALNISHLALKAKKSAEIKEKYNLVLEYNSDIKEEITKALRRFFAKRWSKNSQIQNADNYLFRSFENIFIDQIRLNRSYRAKNG